MRRLTTVLLLTGVALVTTGAAPEEERAMLDAFDAVLTAMAYAAAGLTVFALVWAGFLLMADGAEERGIGRARSAVFLTVAGLALVLSAKGVPAAAAPRADGAPETPESKAPPGLPLAFMLSHLEDEGPVRLDRVRVSICEVLGLELDEPKLGAFAGALNACDFAVQPLVRQHPPGPGKLTAVGVVELDSSYRRQSQVLPLIELTNRAARSLRVRAI